MSLLVPASVQVAVAVVCYGSATCSGEAQAGAKELCVVREGNEVYCNRKIKASQASFKGKPQRHYLDSINTANLQHTTVMQGCVVHDATQTRILSKQYYSEIVMIPGSSLQDAPSCLPLARIARLTWYP